MTDGTKIAIVGAGRVGSTLAYTLATAGLVRTIVLIDADRGRAEGETMDIAHSVSFHAPVAVVAGELADTAGAAITVIAAGAAQQTGESRPALLQRNVSILRDIVPAVVQANPEGMIIIAANPVDALTYAALRLSGLPPSRVFGSGTVLDTARLRAELAVHCHVDARNVHAYVLGEHGDSEFVAWSIASAANVPLREFCRLTGISCTNEDMTAIAQRVRDAAYEIIRRKGGTNFAIAASLTRIIESVVRDEASVLTVSTLVEQHYGIQRICLSLPTIVDCAGARRILPIQLSEDEVGRLRNSAEAVRTTAAQAGID